MTEPVVLVALSRDGLALARRLQSTLAHAEVHGLARRIGDADVVFESAAEHIRSLYEAGRCVVAICATGIVVRALAPVLTVDIEKDGIRLSLFSTISTLGTPLDVTLQETLIESLFPADDATRDFFLDA